MKKGTVLKIGLLVCLLGAFASHAGAEEAKVGSMTLDELKKALGVSFYVQTGFTYNLENPDSQENELRVFDHKADSFGLDLAQVVFLKDPTTGGAGYKIKLSEGETAKWIHSRGLNGSDNFDVTEAFVSYTAPLGRGLRFDFGKFVTYHGAEVIEAKDNVNYSRSLLFNYAIPFTHTGLKMSYGFTDALSVSVHVVNGWDNTDDNNKPKTYGTSITFAPVEAFSTILNLMTGPEQDANSKNTRSLIDWVATIKPMKKLSLILNADYGREQNIASDGGAAKWAGAAGIAKYDFTDVFSLALRAEYFRDRDGVRTGTAQMLKEVTITPEFRLAPGLLVRPEYRHDKSDVMAFNGGVKKSQDTIALGVMYSW